MNCPKCAVPLKEVLYEGVKLDHCEQCDGFWLDDGELRKIILCHEETFTPEQLKQAAEMVEKQAIVGVAKESRKVACPHCGKECVKRVSSGVTIDKCPDGAGVWLDKGEIEMLQAMAEERSSIFTDEQMQFFKQRAEKNPARKVLHAFDRFSVFIRHLLKGEK